MLTLPGCAAGPSRIGWDIFFLSGFVKHLSNREFWRRPAPAWAVAATWQAARVWPLAVLLVGGVLYLPFLDVRPLRFEEGRRALQAIEMLDGGAWWYLRVLGETYINKPPFTPWLISAVALLHGAIDEVAVRLPGILFALIGSLAAGAAASSLVTTDRKVAGLVGGLAFLCAVQLLLKTRVGETDVTVTALCGLAFAIWLWARLQGKVGLLHWALITACFACAALSKGPIPIAFPAMAMIVIPLLEKRYGEAGLALAAIVLAHVPVGIWVWDNLSASNAEHWAVELRVAPNEAAPATNWIKLLHLNDFPLALLYLMPFLPAAVAMAFARGKLPRERRWPIDALILYAVPMTLLTTILPMGKARYAMPAAWPVAVLAGMWVSMKWRQLYFASFLIGAGLVVAVVVQIVQIGFLDGRTPGQRAFRARAEQFSSALAGLPPGPLPLIWTGSDFNYNLAAYAGRRLYLLQPTEIKCRTSGEYLVVDRPNRGTAEAAGWKEFAPLSDWGAIYRRAADAPVDDCLPALRP